MILADHVRATLTGAALAHDQQMRVRVNGTSMRPLVDVGDHVWVERVPWAALRLGDVITVWHNGGLLTHRVIVIDGRWCVTKGDDCYANDASVGADMIVGRVVAVERRAGRVALDRRRWQAAGRAIAFLGKMQAMLIRHPVRWVRASSMIVRVAIWWVVRSMYFVEDVWS